jgi:uncharacterized protein (TIGR02246 family)
MTRLALVFLLSLEVAQVTLAQSASPAATPGSEAESSGLAEALRQYVAAFNAHDAANVAALWSADGVYVDKGSGRRTEGREALAADFTALFVASPQVALHGEIEGVRMVADDAALVDGTSITAEPGAPAETSCFSAVFVKRDGAWLLDSVHESPLPQPESPRQALEPLAWMVGQWRDAGDGEQANTTVAWSPSEAFLIRSYSLERDGEEPFSGTQVIGWDPRAQEIRSWTFNSDGSFGDGVWSKSGDEWLVRASQTLAGGGAATGTQILKVVDANTVTVQTVGKEIDGAMEPASEPVTMVRVAAEAAPSTTAASATPAGEVAP